MNSNDALSKMNIVSAFVDQIKTLKNTKQCLNLAISKLSIFDVSDSYINVTRNGMGLEWESEIPGNSKFDLILGDLPFGLRRIDFQVGDKKLKIRENWTIILGSLKYLMPDGIAIFLVEPIAFGSNEGIKFEETLNSKGYFVNAILNAPEGLLKPETATTPVFVVISANAVKSIFIAELLNEKQSRVIANNYLSSTVANGDLKSGILLPEKSFHSFNRIKIKQQIEKLETQYKEYEEYTLGELAVEINHVKSGDKLNEKNNSIYIPKIGNSPVISKISDAKIKHHNYFQVVLSEKAINGYVSAFFRSDIGKLILDSLTSGTFIPHLNKRELEQALIALPTYEDQTKILGTQGKLHDLKHAIDIFDAELALNPNSSSSILSELDGMLDAIGGLTEIDKIHGIIRQGESKNIEYKETLSLDVRKKTKEKYIELSALKTVVAFLNTEGGTLLIGVQDNG
ncbi:MAG: putative DNA binding domain-containing protein, partial [Candidatus Marinimicrobia bacterium]|nr:putative DNA binding domain-containing protein [Candidatus Neomarinimicrobiota bacterium]